MHLQISNRTSFTGVKEEDNEQWPADASPGPFFFTQNGTVLGLNWGFKLIFNLVLHLSILSIEPLIDPKLWI
jgi:hypothetical protein